AAIYPLPVNCTQNVTSTGLLNRLENTVLTPTMQVSNASVFRTQSSPFGTIRFHRQIALPPPFRKQRYHPKSETSLS
ncbi:MAG: hypothetical protein RLO18_16790, partial [Gimesia chilikensis]